MLTNRPQVLAALLLLASPLLSRAQPPDELSPAAPQPKPQPEPPKELPLLPLKLDEWLAANGGLARLKLKMDNVTADQIAQEVKRQAGVTLVPEGNLRGVEKDVPRFSVEATGQPFWEAVADWNRGDKPDAPKLSLRRDWGSADSWRMVTWNSSQPGRRVLAGPCLLTASYVSINRSRSRSLDPKEDPKTNPKASAPSEGNSMYVQSSMLIDPRLRPQILGLITQVQSASDDRGRALAPSEGYSPIWLDDNNDFSNIELAAPERDATRLRSVKGTMRLAVITQRQKWELDLEASPEAKPEANAKDKPEKSFKSESAEVKVRVDGFEPRPNGWSLRLHLERREVGPPRIFKPSGRNYGNEARLGSYQDTTRAVRLLNNEDQPISASVSNVRMGDENGVRTVDFELTTSRNDNDKDLERSIPVKMSLDLPMEWREVDVPFEFKDLPLP